MQAILLMLATGLFSLGWWSSSLSHNEIQTALSAQFFVFGAFLAGFTCVWGFIEKPRD